MAIRFRCDQCNQLMSIASRKSGTLTRCSGCNAEVLVPTDDALDDGTGNDGEGDLASDDNSGQAKKVTGVESWFTTPAQRRRVSSSDAILAAAESATPAAARVSDGDVPEGMPVRKAQTEFDDMDLTPMVDVTFLLLVFFMITASFSIQKTIQIPPPDPDEQGATQTIQQPEEILDQSLRVEIDSADAIFVDDEPIGDIADLADALRDRSQAEGKNELVILADDNARHETFVAVVDAGIEAGMQKTRVANRRDD